MKVVPSSLQSIASRTLPVPSTALPNSPSPGSRLDATESVASPLPELARSFLGRGWSYPVEDDAFGAAALVSEEDDIRQAIWIILGTAPGERVMRPDFGAGLDALVFEPMNTTTMELVKTRVEEALTRWEPRITLRDVLVGPGRTGRGNPNRGELLVEIRYLIRSSNTDSNLVYPFYLVEGRNA